MMVSEADDYQLFVDKFKPKKTTDDCYTPELVYEAVAGWVSERYGIDRADMVRPFYPGGDYENHEYPDGCAVVDNPPFSILKRICETYRHRGIRYFLFAPALSCIGTGKCAVCASAPVTYENGACVRTSFVTNMEDGVRAMSAPDLFDLVKAADDETQSVKRKTLPKYEFPDEVITAARLGWMSTHHTEFVIPERGSAFIRELDSMRATGKGIFGGGLLLSSTLAAERAAAERAEKERRDANRWGLSEREREFVRYLDRLMEA